MIKLFNTWLTRLDFPFWSSGGAQLWTLLLELGATRSGLRIHSASPLYGRRSRKRLLVCGCDYHYFWYGTDACQLLWRRSWWSLARLSIFFFVGKKISERVRGEKRREFQVPLLLSLVTVELVLLTSVTTLPEVSVKRYELVTSLVMLLTDPSAVVISVTAVDGGDAKRLDSFASIFIGRKVPGVFGANPNPRRSALPNPFPCKRRRSSPSRIFAVKFFGSALLLKGELNYLKKRSK